MYSRLFLLVRGACSLLEVAHLSDPHLGLLLSNDVLVMCFRERGKMDSLSAILSHGALVTLRHCKLSYFDLLLAHRRMSLYRSLSEDSVAVRAGKLAVPPASLC